MPMTKDQKLAAIAAIIADETSAGAATPTTPWWRTPGKPYTPGENAADNPQRAKELAAQNRRVNGDHGSIADKDFAEAVAICDFLGADSTTAAEADGKVEGADRTDTDATIYQVLLGQVNGDLTPGLGGRAKLMYPEQKLADLIHQPGVPVGGNVAR